MNTRVVLAGMGGGGTERPSEESECRDFASGHGEGKGQIGQLRKVNAGVVLVRRGRRSERETI